jgi:hypothetical protein
VTASVIDISADISVLNVLLEHDFFQSVLDHKDCENLHKLDTEDCLLFCKLSGRKKNVLNFMCSY